MGWGDGKFVKEILRFLSAGFFISAIAFADTSAFSRCKFYLEVLGRGDEVGSHLPENHVATIGLALIGFREGRPGARDRLFTAVRAAYGEAVTEAADLPGMLVFRPEHNAEGRTPLSVLADDLATLGIRLAYNPNLRAGVSGEYLPNPPTVYLSHSEILTGRVSFTAIHESIHGILDAARARGEVSPLHARRQLDPAARSNSLDYREYLNLEELMTYSAEMRLAVFLLRRGQEPAAAAETVARIGQSAQMLQHEVIDVIEAPLQRVVSDVSPWNVTSQLQGDNHSYRVWVDLRLHGGTFERLNFFVSRAAVEARLATIPESNLNRQNQALADVVRTQAQTLLATTGTMRPTLARIIELSAMPSRTPAEQTELVRLGQLPLREVMRLLPPRPRG